MSSVIVCPSLSSRRHVSFISAFGTRLQCAPNGLLRCREDFHVQPEWGRFSVLKRLKSPRVPGVCMIPGLSRVATEDRAQQETLGLLPAIHNMLQPRVATAGHGRGGKGGGEDDPHLAMVREDVAQAREVTARLMDVLDGHVCGEIPLLAEHTDRTRSSDENHFRAAKRAATEYHELVLERVGGYLGAVASDNLWRVCIPIMGWLGAELPNTARPASTTTGLLPNPNPNPQSVVL